jgi:hypothetical protein
VLLLVLIAVMISIMIVGSFDDMLIGSEPYRRNSREFRGAGC